SSGTPPRLFLCPTQPHRPVSSLIPKMEQSRLGAGGLSPADQAVLAGDNSSNNSVYKGLVFGGKTHGVFLYTTYFHHSRIDVFAPTGSNGFQPASSTQITGSFTDPDIPAGFAPFGIQNINGDLFVTYALQNSQMHDDVAGPGNGFVDIFDTDGNLLERFA